MPRRAAVDLFLVSFLILFCELTAIRWFGAIVVFLTFFTNIILLASFLGMSIGLLAARRPQTLVSTTLPLLMLSLAAAIVVHLLYFKSADIIVGLGDQRGSPQMIYFGTEYRPADVSRWFVPMWRWRERFSCSSRLRSSVWDKSWDARSTPFPIASRPIPSISAAAWPES